MKVYGFQDSYIDYPGKISVILFSPGCNFRCPSCHAAEIVKGNGQRKEEEVFSYIKKRKGWIDAIVISGGEPTLQSGLEDFLREVKEKLGAEFGIKLDTNGSNTEVLVELLKGSLVDCVALDVKGPPSLYFKLIGKEYFDLREGVEKAIGIIQNFPDYEFRTTVVPVLRDGKFEWFTREEARDMAKWVKSFCAYGTEKIRWYLQPFIARSREEMIDERFSLEKIPKEFQETSSQILEEMRKVMQEYFPNCRVR